MAVFFTAAASGGDPPGGSIVFFGDSLTAGYGVEVERAYPALVEENFRKHGIEAKIVNAGVSGDTTSGGLRRLPWLLKQKPSWVVVALGANDMLRGITPSEAEKNLGAIIAGIKRSGARAVLFGMRATPNLGAEYRKNYDALFARVAKREDVPFLDFFISDVAGQSAFNQADGTHPTDEGHRRVADRVTKFLLPFLKATPRRSN